MRLSRSTLARLPDDIARPACDRAAPGARIVHFGIGAFHRAHQAWYTDVAVHAGDRPWAITGVSLRSAAVADQMNPQGGLYTVAERGADGQRLRVVGSVATVLVASRSPAAVVAAIADPATHIVSFTVTEKGYCRTADGDLDLVMADAGFYPLLAQALRERRAAGRSGLTLLSCDNLADNGRQLERLMRRYLAVRAPDLEQWFADHCTCPSSMVDRIVPATTDADRAGLRAALGGLDDHACVLTEPFSQWVIEDRFAGPRPAWHRVGAQLVDDVSSYETAKLRMLNGAHSALAYCGLLRGYTHVHEAVADPALHDLASRLMRDEAAPTVAAADQNLAGYADALLARFANPALPHRLIQIAMDGSQKIPQRWLATLADNRRAGRRCPAILQGMAAWLRHVRGDNRHRWGPVDDPQADRLAALWADGDARTAVAGLFAAGGAFADHWQPDAEDQALLLAAIDASGTRPMR